MKVMKLMKKNLSLYRIILTYACFGLIVQNGIVIHAPAIAKWTVNKSIDNVLNYYQTRKKARVQIVNVDILKDI